MIRIFFICKYNSELDITDKKLLIYDAQRKIILCTVCVGSMHQVREDNVKKHLLTEKHSKAKAKAEDQNLFQSDVTALLKKQINISVNVDILDHLYRVDMIRSFLIAGIKLSKLTHVRGFLERYSGGRKSTDIAHLCRTYLPTIIEQELNTLRKEIKGKYVRINFDETEIFWVCFCVTIMFIDDFGKIQHRVASLSLYKEAAEEKNTNT